MATKNMTFSDALVHLKSKSLLSREGWNGKNMYIGICDNWNGNFDSGGPEFKILPFIYMKTSQGGIVPWLASQTDILANDWLVVGRAH